MSAPTSPLAAVAECDRDDASLVNYVENASRYDGSRTPPQKIALIHAMKRAGRTVSAIAGILSMDERTVKAVLSRGDDLITDARMLLESNALGFAGDLIQASQEAAKRGKIEGIAAVLDRLGVTEPPKNHAQIGVGVQVVLSGGGVPPELSLAKVSETSEGRENQAGNLMGLIMPVTSTGASPQLAVNQALTDSQLTITQDSPDSSAALLDVDSHDATFVADTRKQA